MKGGGEFVAVFFLCFLAEKLRQFSFKTGKKNEPDKRPKETKVARLSN